MPQWLSAGHAVAADVVVVVAAVARRRKAIMALSTQKIGVTAFYNERHWLSRVIAG